MKEMPQENISSDDKQTQKSRVIENPCTQIFKFMRPKLDNQCEKSLLGNNKNNLLKCPDYESDEFADIEDNAKDSSSENFEPTSGTNGSIFVEQDKIFFPEGKDVDEQPNESMISTLFAARSDTDMTKDNMPSGSHRTQSYNIGASSSHTSSDDLKQIPDFTGPTKFEEKGKFKMTIMADVADLEDKTSPKDCKSSRPKANSLKMKTKVGMRKDKCNVCRARLGLCAIKCRCGGYYCAKHRYDREHNCTFDYKSMGAEEIRKNNPRVIAEKIRKL